MSSFETTPSSFGGSSGGLLTTDDVYEWKGVAGIAKLLGDDHLERWEVLHSLRNGTKEFHILGNGHPVYADS